MKDSGNNRSYLDVLRKLRQMIAKSYPDGGWLPSSREICETHGFNRKTYSKALQCLQQDGAVRSYPKKGYFVNPEFLRIDKVGIVIGDAGESPFLQSDEILSAILAVFRENNFNSQLMQAADLRNVLDKALIHGVQGLVWLFPSEQALPDIKQMNEESGLPIVIASNSNVNAMANCGVPAVYPDSDRSNQIRARFFIERQHRKVAIVSNPETIQRIKGVFVSLFDQENVTPVFIPHDENGRAADLTPLTTDANITGLLIDGGNREIYDIFGALSELPTNSLRDICVHYTDKLDAMQTMYPQIKVTGVGYSNSEILGTVSAQMLMDFLRRGTPLNSRKISYFSLTSQ